MSMRIVAELSSNLSFVLFMYVFLDEYLYKGNITKYVKDLSNFYKSKDEEE